MVLALSSVVSVAEDIPEADICDPLVKCDKCLPHSNEWQLSCPLTGLNTAKLIG